MMSHYYSLWKSLSLVAQRVFGVLFTLTMLTILSFAANYCFVSYSFTMQAWEEILIFFAIGIALFAIYLIGESHILPFVRWMDIIMLPSLVFIIALIPRLYFIKQYLGHIQQVSDFGAVLEIAADNDLKGGIYYSAISSWDFFILYLRAMMRYFHFQNNDFIILNAWIGSCVSVLIYGCVYSAKHSSTGGHSRGQALLAATMYGLIPQEWIWVMLNTPEYLHLLLSFFSAFFGLFFLNNIWKPNLKKWFYLLISTVLLALSGFFKSIAVIYIIAFVIVLIVNVSASPKDLSVGMYSHRLRLVLLVAVIFVTTYSLTTKITWSRIDKAFDTEVNRNPLWHYFYIGLSPQGGVWSPENGGTYVDLVDSHENDFASANNEIRQLIIEQAVKNQHLTPGFFLNKIKVAWSFMYDPFFVQLSLDSDSAVKLHESFAGREMTIQTYYFWMILLTLISGISGFTARKDDSYGLFLRIVLFGFILLLMISEVQSRYKMVMYPILCILSSHGIKTIMDAIKYSPYTLSKYTNRNNTIEHSDSHNED